jgi:beta-N-acetylhexosaminidase
MQSRAAVLLSVIIFSLSAFAAKKPSAPGPIHLDRDGEKWAERTLRHLSLEEKVGQVFMIRVKAQFLNVESPDYLELRDRIRQYHIGSLIMTVPADGIFVYRNEPFEAANLLNRLQKDSKLPLLVAADFERGVGMRLQGTTLFPHAMAFGAAGKLDYAEAFGRITAQESRAIGVQWNFFPDVDVNSNPANPIINTRSFGEDPQQVSELADAYIRGARANGMLTTAKHFPGHGDTATDSHLGLAQVTGDRERLNSVELVPFRNAIADGVDSVMVAHVTVPALDPDPNRIGTTSPAIVTGLLKQQLGFKGIVVTDALEMGGLTHLYPGNTGQASVDAFKAGNDLLILPADLDAAYHAMLAAVRSGEISRVQLDASVLKVLKAKASVGLSHARTVDLDTLPKLLDKPENLALARQISDDAITLVRDNGRLLPLEQSGTVSAALPYQTTEEKRNRVVVVIFSDDVRTDSGRVLDRQIRLRIPDANVLYVDPRFATVMSDTVLNAVSQAQAVVAAVYEIPTAGKVVTTSGPMKNSVGLSGPSGTLLQKILAQAAEKTVLVAMGNPYLAQDFPAVQNYICAYSSVTISEISVAKALFGEIAIHGHLPVTIPNIAARGSGIDRQPQTAKEGPSNEKPKAEH